ncbi:MAG TPA: hypothetical protein VH208_12660 [Myxococcaceae bacterium]|nr:hypothetical protein [Myxococcaceae bacterium]
MLRRALLLLVLAGCGPGGPVLHPPLPPATTFGDYSAQVALALEQDLWAGGGHWHSCEGGCGRGNRDWGNDSLTFTLFMRWNATHDPSLVPLFQELENSATDYVGLTCNGIDCPDWSDMPAWDAVAAERDFEVTGDAHALQIALDAYRHVSDASAYAQGACPDILYQRAGGGGGGLKTLETESNLIKAALLLFQRTGRPDLLLDAKTRYAAVRQHYLDPHLPLYTTYLFDDGKQCTPLPGRFFASVNGNMAWNGFALQEATGDPTFGVEALATLGQWDVQLSDNRGVYANLEADNDVSEPLIEAMLEQAARDRPPSFARDWIHRNAEAAIRNARVPQGLYGRFFDGPQPPAAINDWQTNGGLALAVAAATLEPDYVVAPGSDWDNAQSVSQEISALPASLSFTGSGIALLGTLGEECCESGHASLSVDGAPTVDATGIWQNKSATGRSFDDAVLFAWQWRQSGSHVLTFDVPDTNAKEGGPFLHVRRYLLIP